jgi:hypothetical protein
MGYRFFLPAIFLIISTCVHAQWVRSAKTRAFSRSNAIVSDNAGSVYTGGTFSCITSFEGDSLLNNTCAEISFPPPAATQVDAFLSKHDEDGNLVWVNHYPGSAGNKLFIGDVGSDDVGNCYLTGSYTGSLNLDLPPLLVNNDATTEFFLMKIRPDGVTDWKVSYTVDNNSETASQKIAVTTTAVYITGFVRGKFQIGAYTDSVGRNASFVSAFDLSGNPLWTKNFKEINANGSSRGKAIEAAGDSIWVASSYVDSVRLENDTLRSPVSLTLPAGIICLYDAAGNLQDSVLTTTPFIEGIKLHRPDASLYLTGRAENTTMIDDDDLFTTPGIRGFVSSHDLDLNLKWVIGLTAPSALSLTGNDVDVNTDGSIIAGGTFNAATLAGPVTTATGGGGQNGFMLKVDAAGNEQWLQTLGGAGEDAVLSVTSRDDDHIFAAGYFNQYIRVVGEEIYGDASSSNGFMARMDTCPQLLADMLSSDSIYVCARDSALFQVLNNAAYTYQWYNGSTLLPGATDASRFVKDAGVYTAQVTGLGCTKRTPVAQLFLNPLPDHALLTNDPLENCMGDSVRLTGSHAKYAFQWMNTGVPIVLPADTINTIRITTDGDYSVLITDTLNCFISSDTFKIRFHPYPLNTISPAAGRHIVCSGDSIALQLDTSQPGMKYSWRRNTLTLSADTLSLYYAKTSGIYNAILQNPTGCKTVSLPDTVVIQSSPLVDLNTASAPDQICQGMSSPLITSLVIGQTYEWMRNGAPIPDATTNSLDATLPGQYQVRVMNRSCELLSVPFDLTVNPLPTAAIINNPNHAICEGDAYTLHAQQAALYSYQWIRNNQAMSTATLPDLEVGQTGNYAIRITNQFNCQVVSPVTSVVVNLKPPATITPQGPTTFCAGGTVALRANAGTGLIYQWIRDGNILGAETFMNFETSVTGHYEVQVTNSNNCVNLSPPRAIVVVPIPVATLVSSNGATAICERDSLLLLGGSNPAYAYSWIINGQLLPQLTSSEQYVKSPGTYQVVAAVGTCRDTSTVVNLSMRPNPLPVITRDNEFLSIALFGDIQWYRNMNALTGATQQAIHPDANGSYRVSVTNTAGCTAWSDQIMMCLPVPEIQKKNDILTVSLDANAYSWAYKGLVINGATQRQIKAQQSGSYSVVVTSREGCTMETYPVTVCVPFPYITRDDFSGVLKAFPNPATAYQWYYEGNLISDGKTQVHIPDNDGLYTVTVTDLEGCSSSSEPFAITPVTGIANETAKEIKLYPNPFHHFLIVEKPVHSNAMLLIVTDVLGREVYRHQTTEPVHQVDLNEKNSGIYTLIIQHDGGITERKIVKR